MGYGNDYHNFNDNNYNKNGNGNKRNNTDWISWFLIAAFMFGGAWFIGIPLLLYKLFGSDTPKQQRRDAPSLSRNAGAQQTQRRSAETAKAGEKVKDTLHAISKTPKSSKAAEIALIVAGLILAMSGVAMAAEPLSWLSAGLMDAGDVFQVLWGLAFALGGGAMMTSGFGMMSADKRYPRYLAAIGSNQAIHIPSLARKLGIREKRVKKDLQKMIEKGYFGNAAYINNELGYLFVTSKADEELQEARQRAKEKTKAAREARKKAAAAEEVDAYESLVRQIRDVNDRIAHEEMTKKIYRLESITREIFRTVKETPSKRHKIDKFMTYYLPTTLKLLESYAKLEKTGSDGDNISQSRETIEAAMDNIVAGFEHQLDELYSTEALDIETDIDVMTQMMRRDGVGTAGDFQIPEQMPSAGGSGKRQTSSPAFGSSGSAVAMQQEEK